MATSARILVVEDEPAVARGLRYGLELEGYRVEVAESGTEALKLIRNWSPDLILLDLRLPEMSGFDVLRRLRSEGFRQPVLILTALDDELDRVLGLELGADDYVNKPYSLREVIARVRAMLRRSYGELAIPAFEKVISFGNIDVDLNHLRVVKSGQRIYLTPTEFRILRFLILNPGRVYSREALIEEVWGYDSSLGNPRTVDVHIRHLREKIEDDPGDPRWLVTERGFGYKLNLEGT